MLWLVRNIRDLKLLSALVVCIYNLNHTHTKASATLALNGIKYQLSVRMERHKVL